jgi:uncharacterized OB-fold protein
MTSDVAATEPRSLTAFVAHLEKGTFMLCRCDHCGGYSVPNAEQCETCGSVALRWRAAAGTARLVSWAYDNVSGSGADPQLAPVVIAQFNEGPWWWGRLTLDAPTTLTVGTTLRVDVSADPEAGPLPVFRLAI